MVCQRFLCHRFPNGLRQVCQWFSTDLLLESSMVWFGNGLPMPFQWLLCAWYISLRLENIPAAVAFPLRFATNSCGCQPCHTRIAFRNHFELREHCHCVLQPICEVANKVKQHCLFARMLSETCCFHCCLQWFCKRGAWEARPQCRPLSLDI